MEHRFITVVSFQKGHTRLGHPAYVPNVAKVLKMLMLMDWYLMKLLKPKLLMTPSPERIQNFHEERKNADLKNSSHCSLMAGTIIF